MKLSINDLKIAIIDDSEYSRKGIISILESEGFEVVASYSSSVEAIKNYQLTGANLFLIDVVLPEVSGIELAKVINEKSSSDVRVIMMSSLKSESIIIESISHGAIDFIQKPFDKDTLIKCLKKAQADLEKEV